MTRDKTGVRQRSFADAVATLSETCWEDWPITGPQTFLWCVREARHSRWLVETKLDLSASGVSEHSGVMRILGLCLCYDQLEGAELACLELIARRARMIEFKYKDTWLADGVSSPGEIRWGTVAS